MSHRLTRNTLGSVAAVAIFAGVALAASLPAQAPTRIAAPSRESPPVAPGDANTIPNYRLTTPALRKLTRVQDSLYAMLVTDPALKAKFASVGENDGEAEANALDAMARRLERVPEMKRAITSAGLTAHEYVLAMITVFQAAMTLSVMEMDGPMRVKQLPPGTRADNVAFLKANKTAFDRLQSRSREIQRLTRSPISDADDGSSDRSKTLPPD